MLADLPFWIDALLIFTVLSASTEVGYRIGRSQKDVDDPDAHGGGVALTAAMAVLGLMMALSFSDAVKRYEVRKQAIVEEANALGTAFLRADLMAETGRTELRRALYEYGKTRNGRRHGIKRLESDDGRKLLQESMDRQNAVWAATKAVVAEENPPPLEASLVAAVNDVIDMHTIRVTAAKDRLPGVAIWLPLLVAVTVFSLAGFSAGVDGKLVRLRMLWVIALFTYVNVLVIDMGRSGEGLIRTNIEPLNEVVAQMEAELDD
jgi:hypothetical protein